MYKCPHCGGEMQFLPESGIIKCEFCGSELRPEADELNKTMKSADEHKAYTDEGKEMPEGRIYTCSQCGASIYTMEDTGVTFCSYCGSQAFLESRMKGDENIMPDMVIPFQISKEQCEEIYKQKIRSAWFLPRAMRADNTIDRFRGIYMPCWVYNGKAHAEGSYAGITTTRSGTYDIIKTYAINASINGTYEGFVEDAAASFPDGIMREIAPYDMNAARPFNAKYLTGFYADIGNVPADAYNDKIYRTLDAAIKNDLADQREISKHNVTNSALQKSTDVRASISEVKKGFFPVWFLSNRNDRTGLMSYAVINGLNGRIHADLPVDMKKYLLLSLAIAVPIFLILQFFTMKPNLLLLITMVLLGIMMFFATKMIGDAYIQEQGLDDMGLQYLKDVQRRSRTGAAQSPDGAAEYIAPAKDGSSRQKRSPRKAGQTILGSLCFIGLPMLAAVVYFFTGINLIVLAFIAGIAIFIASLKAAPDKKKDKDSEFTAEEKIRLPFFMILRAIMLPAIGILAGAAVLIINPVHDLYYYGAAVLCCVMLILTVLDFVRSNNRLSLRKPAQLDKRGGDENA